MTKLLESTDWNKLRDVYGKPAASLPRLLLAMWKGEPKDKQQEAEFEFWQRINDGSLVCDATAPALSVYFSLVEEGKIEINANFLFACSTLYDECAPVDQDNARTRLIKSAVRATIQRQKPFLWSTARIHLDSMTRSVASELLIQLGERPTELFLKQLESASDPKTKADLLYLLFKVRDQISNWEEIFRGIVANDTGAPRFRAAAHLVIASDGRAREMMDVLREYPSLGRFSGYSNLLFDACAALAPADRVAVLEDILRATNDSDEATYISRELLTAVFEVASRPVNRETVSGPEGTEYTWLPKRPYANRKRLDAAARDRLCALLSNCDALWRDHLGRPVLTNLWRQFGLPADRESMKQMAQKHMAQE